jgi:hypothetical protein
MQVTKELKKIIKDEFNKKREDISKKYNEIREKEFSENLKKFDKDMDFHTLQYIAKNLNERYKDCGNYTACTDFFSKLCNAKANDFLYKRYGIEITDKTNELKTIDNIENALLIKLAYEKDFESIKQILSEYQIEI